MLLSEFLEAQEEEIGKRISLRFDELKFSPGEINSDRFDHPLILDEHAVAHVTQAMGVRSKYLSSMCPPELLCENLNYWAEDKGNSVVSISVKDDELVKVHENDSRIPPVEDILADVIVSGYNLEVHSVKPGNGFTEFILLGEVDPVSIADSMNREVTVKAGVLLRYFNTKKSPETEDAFLFFIKDENDDSKEIYLGCSTYIPENNKAQLRGAESSDILSDVRNNIIEVVESSHIFMGRIAHSATHMLKISAYEAIGEIGFAHRIADRVVRAAQTFVPGTEPGTETLFDLIVAVSNASEILKSYSGKTALRILGGNLVAYPNLVDEVCASCHQVILSEV